MSLPISHIDRSWSLFLDRDGVINRHVPNDYVKSVSEFEILPDVPQAIARLTRTFGRLFVATNQQGVGKGLYTLDDLELIHAHMLRFIATAGGRIDRIYVATQLAAENSPWRKPGIGMALQAKQDFPEIDLRKSVMVGDSLSDMQFGRNAGMFTVWVGSPLVVASADVLIDAAFPSVSNFADTFD